MEPIAAWAQKFTPERDVFDADLHVAGSDGSGRSDAYDSAPPLAGMAYIQPNVYGKCAVSRSLGCTQKRLLGSILLGNRTTWVYLLGTISRGLRRVQFRAACGRPSDTLLTRVEATP